MVKPQTARRRQRVQQQAQQHAQQAQQHADEIGGMHDEADIMSFRSAATQRFLLNQELMENVTEKWIHINNIAKPSPFANVHTTKTQISEIKDELYFGNVDLMKQKLEQLNKEVQEVKEAQEKIQDELKDVKYLHTTIDTLGKAYEESQPLDIDSLESEFTQKHDKHIKMEHYTKRSIPGLRNDTSEASATYWDDLKNQRLQQEAQEKPIGADNDVLMTGNFNMPQDTQQPPPQMGGYDQNFGGGELDNLMEDVNFGMESALDDQDFLSQIDHSME